MVWPWRSGHDKGRETVPWAALRHRAQCGAIVVAMTLSRDPLAAQQDSGVVTGVVHDARGPVSAAMVFLDQERRRHTTADDSGRFTLQFAPVGRHTIRAESPGMYGRSNAFEVYGGQTTDIGVLDLGPDGPPREVWFGCRGASRDGATCDTGRRVVAPLRLPGSGVGVVRDSGTWAVLWHAYKGRFYNEAIPSRPKISWGREVVLLFTSFAAPATSSHSVVNRVIEWPDSAVVEIGPDSVIERGIIVDFMQTPHAVVVRRTDAPFKFHYSRDSSVSFRVVDWRAIARMCPDQPSRPECACEPKLLCRKAE